MGKTIRKIVRFVSDKTDEHGKCSGKMKEVTCDDTQAKYNLCGWLGDKKMPPYTKDRLQWKFKSEESWNGFRTTTQHSKDVIRNANRSLKKGKRQQLKKELRKMIDDLDKDNLGISFE